MLSRAEEAGDAGSVATTRLNLAAIAKAQGDLAAAIRHLEAAVDMGRRSGRVPTLRQSAGVLAYRVRDGALEVFLVHPGGPFWKNKDAGAWSIPKGEFDATEAPLAAARREFGGIDIAKDKGPWYRDTGSGMGPTLNTASGMNAYALTDRGTWLSFKNRGELVISVEGDKRLFNQYGVILVNPAKHPHVKIKMGLAFIDWVISREGQKAIADYKIGGQQLFFPNANTPGA